MGFHLLPSSLLVARGEKIDAGWHVVLSSEKVKLKGSSVCPMKLPVSLRDGLKTREWTERGMTY